MNVKYTISDKIIKERDGAAYDLSKYVEGVDYVIRGCFKGHKAVFRSDILESKADDQAKFAASNDLNEVPVDLNSIKSTFKQVSKPVVQTGGNGVYQCKVVKIWPNARFVETDTQGRIFAGLKGTKLRRSQIIKVKDGQLYLN